MSPIFPVKKNRTGDEEKKKKRPESGGSVARNSTSRHSTPLEVALCPKSKSIEIVPLPSPLTSSSILIQFSGNRTAATPPKLTHLPTPSPFSRGVFFFTLFLSLLFLLLLLFVFLSFPFPSRKVEEIENRNCVVAMLPPRSVASMAGSGSLCCDPFTRFLRELG